MRLRRPRATGLLKPRGLRGGLPRDFARQIQRRRPAHLGLRGEAAGAPRGPERLETNWRAPGGASVASGRQVSRVRGALGGPGATCSARAVRAEARAQSPPGGGARLRATTSPPPQLPGARPPGGGSGRCRVRAVLDREPQEDAAGRCPGALHRRASERPPVPGLLEPVCVSGSVLHWMGKITGQRGARGGAAPWGSWEARPDGHRAGPRTGERATEGHFGAPNCQISGTARLSAARPHSGPGVSRLSRCPSPGLWSASSWDGCGLRRDRWDSGAFKESPALARSWAPSSSSAAGPLAGEAASPVLPVPSHSLPRLVHPRESSRSVRALPHCLIYLWHIPAVFQEGFVRGGAL